MTYFVARHLVDYDNFVVRRLLNGAGTVVTVAGASGKLGRPPTTPSALVGTPIGPINGFAWALNSSVLYASDCEGYCTVAFVTWGIQKEFLLSLLQQHSQ